MINLENILNSPLENNPWEYKYVKNILSDEFYNLTAIELQKLENYLTEKEFNKDGFWLFELLKYGVSQSWIDKVFEINYTLLKNANKILERFKLSNTSKIGYFGIPRIGFCTAHVNDKIHDDGDDTDKSLIMTIYILPETCYGTQLYSDNNSNSFVKSLDWNTNQALVFAPAKNITWHQVKNGDQPRITLSFYYERIEDLYINRLSKEKIEWFYSHFDQLLLELKDCN